MDAAPDMQDELPDDVLLARFAAGDQGAARVLAARHAPRCLALAARVLRGDRAEAEDVTQEAMLRLWKIAPDWQPGRAKPSTWLHTVTLNLCRDRLRKRPSTPLEDAPEPVDPAPSARDGLETADRVRALREALADLPERQREAIALRHFQELGNEDIAATLDISVEAVESLLSRGRRALKARLAPQIHHLAEWAS